MKHHPNNHDFSWQPPTGPYRLITDEQAAQWQKDGYFLLRGAFDKETIASVAAEIDPFEAQTEKYLREKQGGRMGISAADDITFTIHLVKRSPLLKDFCARQVFADLCIDLVGASARLYWDQAVYKKPETEKEFPWHQDNGYTFVKPQDYLTCWVPLTSATIDNGCPWVMPGVQRQGTLEHWETPLGYCCLSESQGAVPVEAEPGDVVVFSSLTPHRTGPNLTDSVRKAYIVQYAHDDFVMYPRDTDKVLFQIDPERQFLVARDGQPVTTLE